MIAFAIGALMFWNLILSFLVLTALLASKKNDDEIEAIKSWYPLCEIMKIKIPEEDDSERREPWAEEERHQ